MKNIFVICLTAIICSQAFSQQYTNNWYFGVNASINFSGGVPVYQSSPMASFEANATISDSLGNLLFFTNGESIWDKNGNEMPNGDSLEIARQYGVPFAEGSSVTQGIIILPVPESSTKYYVFYLTPGNNPGDMYNLLSLMYSVVDMTLNGGNGDVISGQKNVLAPSCGNYIWEKMTAVKHGNGKDWWLVTLSGRTIEMDSCYFEKFLITADSISSPQFQSYDVWSDDLETFIMELGQMKFSSSGKKLGVTRGSYVDVFSFDRCDASFSNRLTVDSVHFEDYGLEFSPDETKLYITTWGLTPNKPALVQICLNCNIPIKTTLFTHSTNFDFGQLQVAPDGKIYTGFAEIGFLEDDARYLSVINYPDSFGVDCDFELASFALGDSGRIRYGLPNFVNYDLPALTGPDSCDSVIIAVENLDDNYGLNIFPNPACNYIFLLDSKGKIPSFESLLFFNSAGILVKSVKPPAQSIDISDLPNGIYLVKASSNSSEYISRLEILR